MLPTLIVVPACGSPVLVVRSYLLELAAEHRLEHTELLRSQEPVGNVRIPNAQCEMSKPGTPIERERNEGNTHAAAAYPRRQTRSSQMK